MVINKHQTALSLVAVMATQLAWSIPAFPGLMKVQQPDGSVLEVFMQGDERGYLLFTSDTIAIAQDKSGYYCYATGVSQGLAVAGSEVAHNVFQRSAKESKFVQSLKGSITLNDLYYSAESNHSRRASHRLKGYKNVPSIGKFHGLVIMANYTDLKFQDDNTQDEIYRMMNETGYDHDGAQGSVADYFKYQSGGLFEPDFDVVGPVTLSHDMSYYGSDVPTIDCNLHLMISEACRLADEEFDVDFSRYDNNGDGLVDMVYIIYAGHSQNMHAPSNTIWPQMWYLTENNATVELDGVTVNTFATGGELYGNQGTQRMGIGLICHEFSHTLGVPDIYDTSTNSPVLLNLGTWDLMATGCYNNNAHTPCSYCSFEKVWLGWADPIKLTDPVRDFRLESLSGTNQTVRLSNPNNPNECFYLENRTRTDHWDAYLPAEGMLVVHVNYDTLYFEDNKPNINDRDNRVHIISANGNNVNAGLDYEICYPGSTDNRYFSACTTPSSTFADGTVINEPILNIDYSDGIVTFDYGFCPESPIISAETNVSQTGFQANWSRISDARYYELKIVDTTTLAQQTYSRIQRNRFTLSNLDAYVTYIYQVRSQDDYAFSEWSEPRSFCISQYSAIETIIADNLNMPRYDIFGHRITRNKTIDSFIIQNNKTAIFK